MTIETKRNLLRISRERALNPYIKGEQNLNQEPQKFETTIPAPTSPPIIKTGAKRIKTEIKSQNLGKNLNPDYINKYKGGTFIVAGCGTSINLYEDFSKYFVIGVNDIDRILTPDFLVVVNDFRTFMRGRWDFVRSSISPVIFSHLDNPGPLDRPQNLVRIQLGERNNPRLDQFEKVDHTMNSPYMAAIIAYQLGARKIGLVGVDFTQDHFFSPTGVHKLTKHIRNIDNEYAVLYRELEKRGVKAANISPISLLESWPKMSLEDFDSL